MFEYPARRAKHRLLSNGVILWIGSRSRLGATLVAGIKTGAEYRSFRANSAKELIGKVRLALSRGTDDIFWDTDMIYRLKGGSHE